MSTDLLNLIDILRRQRRFIVGVVGAVAITSIVVSFFLPKWYQARSTLLPPDSGADISSTLASLVQGFSLPGMGGLGATSPEAQLFLAILDSRNLREQLVRKYGLMSVYKSKTMDDALRTFGRLAASRLTDQGIVEVTVEDRDPKRAADIANSWVALLDDYNRNARMTAGRRTRIFVEGRLADTKAQLEASEDALADYQRVHKNVALTSEASAAISAGASIIAKRMAQEVRLSYLRDLYRDPSPQISQAEAELAALDRQIGSLPPIAMDYARLLRGLKVQEQVYALLVAQYEEARIREHKDVPTLDVLDKAVPPERRVRPIRWLFCTSLTLAALVVTLGVAFGAEFVRRLTVDGPPPAGRVGHTA